MFMNWLTYTLKTSTKQWEIGETTVKTNQKPINIFLQVEKKTKVLKHCFC